VIGWWLLACGGDGTTAETVDSATPTDTAITETSDTAPPQATDTGEPVDPACVDVPLITYATFGDGFLTFYCQGCHGSESDERFGAPENVTFDDHDQASAWLYVIRDVVIGDRPSMPPAGGMPSEELERLRIWIDCWGGV